MARLREAAAIKIVRRRTAGSARHRRSRGWIMAELDLAIDDRNAHGAEDRA
jgi:hypothetical protein